MTKYEFVKRNGDVIEYITCTAQEVTIHEGSTKCFEDIPIITPTGIGFIQQANRLFKSKSAHKPCSDHFGLKILTRENVWVEINPNPKQIPIPGILPRDRGGKGEHEDLSAGGLYLTK